RPKEAKRVSEFDSTVDKETQRSRRAPPSVPKGQPKASDVDPSGGGEKSSGGKALPLGGRQAAGDADARPGLNEAGKPSPGMVGPGTTPSLSPRAAKGLPDAVRKNWSPPGTRQNFDDVDEGDSTVLNTHRWKYASFFNRLKNDIDQYWDPVARLRARDPDGRINGTKTRRTKLMIILNGDGSLHKVKLVRSCNVDYLDDEAIRAVRSAAPFPNPPKGMLDPADGKLYVPFGFIVEMGKKGGIQRYRR
ncbi:MAG: energy transducer TonB, partial [Myxococcota bacterium]